MTRTIINNNTSDRVKGKYVVARYITSYSYDFLHEWDDEYGASFTGINGAMIFETKKEALEAAIKAKRIVPVCVSGSSFAYDACIAG